MKPIDYIPTDIKKKLSKSELLNLEEAMNKFRYLKFTTTLSDRPEVVSAFSIAEQAFCHDTDFILTTRSNEPEMIRYCVAYYLISEHDYSYTMAAKAIGLLNHSTITAFYENHVHNEWSLFWKYWNRFTNFKEKTNE